MTTVIARAEKDLSQLLHDWRIVSEYDGGYVLGRCAVCGTEDLLDISPTPDVRLCAI